MSKILKRIACIIGLVLLIVVFALNIVYMSHIAPDEKVTADFNNNNIQYLLGSIFIAAILYNTCKIIKIKIDKKKESCVAIEPTNKRKYYT